VASWKVQITCKDATAKVITVKKVVGYYVGHHLLIQLCIDLLWTLARPATATAIAAFTIATATVTATAACTTAQIHP